MQNQYRKLRTLSRHYSALFSEQQPTHKFREETEGERRHLLKEMDIVYRNPQLRQQCLDKYGYQCQCCGMDFATVYGKN